MLQQLVEFTHKHLDSEPGFTTRTVQWLAEISKSGEFINIIPLGDGKTGEQISRCPEMHNMNAGGRSHFLVETVQTIALYFKSNEDEKKIISSTEKHEYFKKLVIESAKSLPVMKILSDFINNENQLELLRQKLAVEKVKPTDWICWRIDGIDPIKEDAVIDWWRQWRKVDKGEDPNSNKAITVKNGMVCFLTGDIVDPVSTQPKINGLSTVGGISSGDVMAGFDKDAFCSYNLKQASNAAMGEKSVREFVDALNYLIKNESRKLANSLVIHWYKQPIDKEDDPLDFLCEPPEITEGAAQQSVRQILDAYKTGKKPVPTNNQFYSITLSGASGRVMTRDWMEGSFKELIIKIDKWFADFEIIAREGNNLAPSPKLMAICGAMVRDLKDIPAPTTSTLWRIALLGLPIPQPFLALALNRFRVELIDDKPFNHARMGLIKAYFIRKGGDNHMSAYLNTEHPDPAYQCGRLLAVLARLQHAALGDVGAGVVQRYYVAASQTPGLTLGRLFNNAKNHLGKLDGGLTYWYEDQIAEIMSHIQEIPTTLNLEQQSLFALGYYQQIAFNRTKNTTDTKGEN